jgi:hypothetical protein
MRCIISGGHLEIQYSSHVTPKLWQKKLFGVGLGAAILKFKMEGVYGLDRLSLLLKQRAVHTCRGQHSQPTK